MCADGSAAMRADLGLDLAGELEIRAGVVDLGGKPLEVGTLAGSAHDAQYGARQLVA